MFFSTGHALFKSFMQLIMDLYYKVNALYGKSRQYTSRQQYILYGHYVYLVGHSEHLGRFRGKLASDVLELLGTLHIILDVVSALLLTFAFRHIFRQNSFVLKALYTSDEQEFLGYILYIISINLYYRSKYFLA